MIDLHSRLGLAMVVLASAVTAYGQTPSGSPADTAPLQTALPGVAPDAPAIPVASTKPSVQMMESFTQADVKFDVDLLMNLLRDRNHEGWVLAAYPDPKTGQPLIGAGVSIDLPAREHLQRDPLNRNPFLEPASAELWQAAGLEPERLNRILDDFHQKLDTWGKQEYRSHISELSPQITEDEAGQLLRVAIVQSILNAKAYCRSFDRLSGWQQMSLSQLVFQMGTNLEEFTQFLDLINSDDIAAPLAKKVAARDVAYWNGVQKSLIQSQWARLYRSRAISVIAMLDPRYNQNPRVAERRVGAVLRPAVVHRRRTRSAGSSELASASKGTGRHVAGRAGHSRRRKA